MCKELAPSTSACKHGNAKPVLSTDQSIDQMRKSLEWIGCWTAPHSWLLCIVCMRPYTVWLCFGVQCEIKSLHQWLECVGAFYEKEIQSVLSNKLIKQELFGKIRDTFIIPSSGYENSKVQQATTGLVRKVLKWHLMISLKGKDRFLSLIAPLCNSMICNVSIQLYLNVCQRGWSGQAWIYFVFYPESSMARTRILTSGRKMHKKF